MPQARILGALALTPVSGFSTPSWSSRADMHPASVHAPPCQSVGFILVATMQQRRHAALALAARASGLARQGLQSAISCW